MTQIEESYFMMKQLRELSKTGWKVPEDGYKAWDDALLCMKEKVDQEYMEKYYKLRRADGRNKE